MGVLFKIQELTKFSGSLKQLFLVSFPPDRRLSFVKYLIVHVCPLTSKVCVEIGGLGMSFPKSWEREWQIRNGNSAVSCKD